MAWTNDMVDMMRQGGSSGPGGQLKIAMMTGPTTLKIGNLILEKEDLLFAEHLIKPIATVVKETAPAGGGTCTDQSTYLPALKTGDQVAVVQISDSKFLVLGRMVTAP